MSMFTPIKGPGGFNETILNTPQPQASSTVRRKSPLESKFNDKHRKDGQNVSYEKLAHNEQNSSLGLLGDISGLTNMSTTESVQKFNQNHNIDAELECEARRLLQKCSDTKNSSLTVDMNKENNANIQNITDHLSVSNFTLPKEPCTLELDQECNTNRLMNEVSMTNVAFDPNEITARSSGVHNSAKEQSLSSKSFSGINFSTDDIMMQVNNKIMEQLNNEEFLSGSKVAEQLSIDEVRWQQDRTYCMPLTNTEMQKLDLTSFSGVIGQLDLSVESCAGRKLSIGQYFERKSADLAVLGNNKQVKPNFDLTLESSIKKGNLESLVESTVLTNANVTLSTESKEEFVTNATKDMNKTNIISLSTILNTLQNVDSGTPRRLVDQILMAQKKKKDAIEETFMLPSNRKSMLAIPAGNSNKFDQDIPENLPTKLSLDSNIVIGKNTERLCNCIIGMISEVNIELLNHGDRWITYSLTLKEVLGDMQSIELNIPQDEILIEPNGEQSSKIKVKVIQMCEQIFVALNIILTDMVTKSKWYMKHMICVNPEQLELEIICDSHKEELDFQYIIKDSAKILPIIFHNKNSIDVPIKLSILHDGPKMFSIDGTFDKSIKLNESHDELTNLILKPHEKFTINIKCEQSTLIDVSQKQLQHWKSILIIHVPCDDTILFQKKVPLYAQMGICKIQIVDTEVPIIVSRQQGKLLNVINSGNVATHVFATIVPIEEYSNSAQNFSIEPDNIFLQIGEKNSFLIVYKSQVSDTSSSDNERCAMVKLITGNNVYLYVISTEQISPESEKENYLRCHTPSNAVSLSPATSPQSVTSNRSGPSDRNSPISTVSGVTVAGNIIPVKSTHAALIWNSVKTGKNEIKEFKIRNISNNKIKIQIDIWDDNKSFKFLGDRQTLNTSMILALQRQELKTLAVNFSPYHTGPVIGKITIKHYTRDGSDSQQHKKIPLYGYGGYSKIKISNIFKDANGKMGKSLGTLCSETTVLTADITLQNIGDLYSFAKIKVIPKVISPTMNSWHVNPKELILKPKETRQVLIEFYPKKEDFAMLQHSEVSHVATVNVTYGDEPTRWRIRRLSNKIMESNNPTENENEAFKNIVQSICKNFVGEQVPIGLSIYDSIQNLNDLCTGVHQDEIMLTVEACADDTLPVYDADESQMYYTLSDTTHMDEADGASCFTSQLLGEQFTVTPSTVVLRPPVETEATVTIFSSFKTAEPFQTNLLNSNYLSVIPTEGMLPSRRRYSLKIQCSQRIERNMQTKLEIYTENNKQDVLIKVIRQS
ncbi:hypothetical protein EAG_01750 [Camponotus floridanus]|uniref:Centrosomal protein of 192 kDa n=1 Tax=Camponotus floridanus TaxID=104421 RepID=E2AX47_CAMFO|nr:hypothetical protein EAG_01750 [Camponotus floridanus]